MKKSANRGKHYPPKSSTAVLLISMLIVTFITFWNTMADDKTDERKAPFYPGEKLTFHLRWGFIPAGKAVLEVFPTETINGVETYHFVMSARTNSFIDTFYKVRDRIDAHADLLMTHTVLYKKNQREGKTIRDVIVSFNWKKNEASYSNFNEKKEPISILPGSFDPLSIFYYLRHLDIDENTEFFRPVTDGKKSLQGRAKVIKRETVSVAAGTFDTFMLEPDLKDIGGVFKKSKNAKIKIWVTADSRHLLVKIKSKVIIGSFIGELISIEQNNLK